MKIEARTNARVELRIPNQVEPDVPLTITVEKRAVVVSYGWNERLHFGYGEPDPPIEDALGFIRDLLSGNVELEIVYGWVWTRVTTARVGSSTGERVPLQSGFTPAIFAGGLRWPPRRRELRRISFT